MSTKARLADVDLVKAFGIILMIMGHIGFGYTFDFYIHSFHMPLFFAMAGYVFKDKDTSFLKYSKYKVRTLLVPYLAVGLFHYFLKLPFIIRNGDSPISPLISLFFYNSDGIPIAGALWFLTAIFFAYDLMYLVRLIHSFYIQIIVSITIAAIGFIVSNYVHLPLSIGPAMTCFSFMYVGWLVRNKIPFLLNNIGLSFVMLILGFTLASLNTYVNVRIEQYGNPFIFVLSASLIIIGLQGILKVIYSKNRLSDELLFIGINSLVYMCFNQLVLWVPNKLINTISTFEITVLKIIELILALAILKIVTLVLNKSTFWLTLTGKNKLIQ